MEKRLVLFLVLAFAIFAGYSALMQKLYPPPAKQLQANRQVADKKDAEKEKEQAQLEPKPQPVQPPAQQTPAAEDKNQAEKVPEAKTPEAAVIEEPAAPEQWVTLGSADHNDPYRMLV